MTSLLASEDTSEILAVFEDGGLLDDPTFTSVAIAAVKELAPKRSLSAIPRVAAKADLAMLAEHGDKALLFAWLAVARTRLGGSVELVRRLDVVIDRTVGQHDEAGQALAWSAADLLEISGSLANLYSTPEQQRAFAIRAKLVVADIAFDPTARVSWIAIVQHALHANAVERVLDVALEDFPQNQTLLAKRPSKAASLIEHDAIVNATKAENQEGNHGEETRSRSRSEDRAVLVAEERPAAPAELPAGAPQRRRPIG